MRAAIFMSVLLVGGLVGCASRPGFLRMDPQEEAVYFARGTAWSCAVGDTLDCGERATKGQDHGDRFFVSLFERPSEAGFHGVFYVGAVSASPPAVRPGGAWASDSK